MLFDRFHHRHRGRPWLEVDSQSKTCDLIPFEVVGPTFRRLSASVRHAELGLSTLDEGASVS